MTDDQTTTKDRRLSCWDEAVHSYGSAYVFEKRAELLRPRRQWLVFIGIASPVAVGAVALSLGLSSPIMPYVLAAAALLLVVQLVVAVWALVARWDDQFAYALESTVANYHLADQFARLGEENPSDLERRFELLKQEHSHRSQQDYKQGVADREKRMGMRRGLWKYRRPCVVCGQVPPDMNPSSCSTCGNF